MWVGRHGAGGQTLDAVEREIGGTGGQGTRTCGVRSTGVEGACLAGGQCMLTLDRGDAGAADGPVLGRVRSLG